MATIKNITAANVPGGIYTPVLSDKGKYLMFYVPAIIQIPKGVFSAGDEFEVTQMSTGEVSFVDNNFTGDIRCSSENPSAMSWKLARRYESVSVRKIDTTQYLLTGFLI